MTPPSSTREAPSRRTAIRSIHFADDWGTQSGMMISPRLWRELFRPRYARQFALAHDLGLDTWYHCCGEFLPIMEDLHEIVQALNDIGYRGPLSVEWEDCGVNREYGAAEACAFTHRLDFPPADRTFDAAFESK